MLMLSQFQEYLSLFKPVPAKPSHHKTS